MNMSNLHVQLLHWHYCHQRSAWQWSLHKYYSQLGSPVCHRFASQGLSSERLWTKPLFDHIAFDHHKTPWSLELTRMVHKVNNRIVLAPAYNCLLRISWHDAKNLTTNASEYHHSTVCGVRNFCWEGSLGDYRHTSKGTNFIRSFSRHRTSIG